MTQRVVFSREAKKHYENLETDLRDRVKKKLETIALDPFNVVHSKALVGRKGVRSARVGDWRILFAIDDVLLIDRQPARLINVAAIRHRREVYRE